MGLKDVIQALGPATSHDRDPDRELRDQRAALVRAAAAARGAESDQHLRARSAEQDREIAELHVALVALVEVLRDTGALDEKVYRYRLEGELAARSEGAAVTPPAPSVNDRE
jgi:hypothetical protein